MLPRWRAVVAVLALALVACGGGGAGDGEDPLALPPGAGRPADTATARTIVLQESDMPSGWRGAAHTTDAAEQARSRDLASCLGRPDPETTRSAIVYGPDLGMDRLQVSTIATVLNTVEDARADLEAVRGDMFEVCVVGSFAEDLRRQAPDAQVGEVSAEPLQVQTFGDGTVGVRLTTELVYPDRTERLFADLVYMSKDRATVSATFFSFGEPFPADLQESLVSRVGNRVAAA